MAEEMKNAKKYKWMVEQEIFDWETQITTFDVPGSFVITRINCNSELFTFLASHLLGIATI